MTYTNSYLLTHVLGPIGGTADYDDGWQKYKDINGEDENQVKAIFIEKIKPYFEARSEQYKTNFKNTLSYYLTTDSIDFESEYEGLLSAFDPPREAKKFFVWLWEVLFPAENYRLQNVDNYVERYDIKPGL